MDEMTDGWLDREMDVDRYMHGQRSGGGWRDEWEGRFRDGRTE